LLNPLAVKLQRCLRNNMTDAKRRLWRFWNNEIMTEINPVRAVIWRTLQELDPTPIPAFPLKGKELSSGEDV
jgi:very-short-patch-repair endonuclease